MAPRFALVNSRSDSAEQVARFLPVNYYLAKTTPEGFLIAGSDSSGWTLDDYIIPRLQSGLISCHEIPFEKALALGFQVEEYVITNEEALFWSNDSGWVSLASATLFGRHELAGLNKPQSSLSQWVTLHRAAEIEAYRQSLEEPSLPS